MSKHQEDSATLSVKPKKLHRMGKSSLILASEIVGNQLSQFVSDEAPVFTITIACGDDLSGVKDEGILKVLQLMAPNSSFLGIVETGWYETCPDVLEVMSGLLHQVRMLVFDCTAEEVEHYCVLCDGILSNTFHWRRSSHWQKQSSSEAIDWLKYFVRSPVAEYRWTDSEYFKPFRNADSPLPDGDGFHTDAFSRRPMKRPQTTYALYLRDILVAQGKGVNILSEVLADPAWRWGQGDEEESRLRRYTC